MFLVIYLSTYAIRYRDCINFSIKQNAAPCLFMIIKIFLKYGRYMPFAAETTSLFYSATKKCYVYVENSEVLSISPSNQFLSTWLPLMYPPVVPRPKPTWTLRADISGPFDPADGPHFITGKSVITAQ